MTDSDLQLNIFVRESEQYRGQKVKITGKTWKQRVKSRKLLKQKSKLQEKDTTKDQGRIYNPHNEQKHEKEKKEKEVNDTGQRESKKQNEIKEDKSDKSDDKQKDIRKRKLDSSIPGADPDFGTKKMKPGQIISSLFTFNPQIPQVESVVPVAQIKEDLFSSKTFRELGLHPHLASTLEEKMKITQMTSVQQKAIPHVMMGTDTLVQSQTGSGKTMVFAVPIVQALQALTPKVSRIDGPYALVVVPTRELALQCYQTFEQLLNPFLWIVPGCIVGGVKRKAEKARLRKGINILVCTPGRLIDHIRSTGCLSLKRIRWLIIDEADRLLDMGYEKDVAQIINSLNMAKPVQGSEVKQRQTVLLSATLTQGVQRMAGISVTDPVRVDLSQTDQVTTETIPTEKSEESWNKAADQGTFSVPDNLRQHFIITPCKLRLVTLAAFIIQKCRVKQKPGKMVVFLPTQGAVEFHHCVFNHFFGGGDSESDMLSDLDVDLGQKNMAEDDLQFFKLHGEMPQSDRVNVYHNFSKAKSGILLCTDVACRGLDLPNVRWIVQYTAPVSTSDYVHRVGRTARAGKLGHSLLFLLPSEVEFVAHLNKGKIGLEELQMDSVLGSLLGNMADLEKGNIQREPPRTYEEAATYLQMCVEQYVHDNSRVMDRAVQGFQSFVKAYATYPSDMKSIFHVKHLHLGHVAKSFGLRESPSGIKSSGTKRQHGKHGYKEHDRLKSKKRTVISEFGSGLNESGKLAKLNKIYQKSKKHEGKK